MPVDVSKVEITELARVLEEKKNENRMPALVLGARVGGLFHSEYFYETLQHYYSKRFFTDFSQREQFSECYHILNNEPISKTDLRVILTRALQNINHTIADDCVAGLVQQGLFKVVFSTNADDLLEKAFITLGMKEWQDFTVFFPERHSIEDIVFHEKLYACKLIKLSGDLQTIVYNLGRPDAQVEKSQSLRNLLEKMRTKEVLIVGVDPVWDVSILSAFPAQIETLWLVNEDEAVKDAFISHCQQVKRIRYVVGADGSYDKFFKGMHWHINQGIPRDYEFILEVFNQQGQILQEIQRLKEEIQRLKEIGKDIAFLKSYIIQASKPIEK